MTPTVSILLYHEIGLQPRASANLDCFCSSSQFREQMYFLKASAVPVRPASEVYDQLCRGEHVASNTVVLTFDDGDTSFLDHALPVLDELAFPATVFAVAGQLGQKAHWVKDPRNAVSLMTPSHLRTLAAHQIAIGSHSMSHRKLPELPASEIAGELYDSKALLEDILGKAVTSFAYPHGRYDNDIMSLVEAAGYRYSYSTDGGRDVNGKTDRFCIPRKFITYHDRLHVFAAKLRF